MPCRLCVLEAADFLDALFAKLVDKYGNLSKYDVDGKLDSLLDPHTANDQLRVAFLLPSNDAALDVAEEICELVSVSDNVHHGFLELADLLLQIAAVPRVHNDEAPDDFAAEAFPYYLQAFSTEGPNYYLSPEEVLATAEAMQVNVVITRLQEGHHLGCNGEIAVLVLRGADRGHFERLCNVASLKEAEIEQEAEMPRGLERRRQEERRKEPEERRRRHERARKSSSGRDGSAKRRRNVRRG